MHTRMQVLNAILETKLLPLFYHGELEIAQQIVDACIQGGATVIEFTNRGANALNVFAGLRQQTTAMLGVGSIVDAPTAALFIAHGADFIVSPLLNPEIATLCNRRKIPYLPGCATLTEISQAEALGVEIVKLFPGKVAGGPAFVKSVLAPCPWTSIMPTGGVQYSQEDIQAWFAAGVVCVGMGSQLISQDDVENYDAISQKVSQVLTWIRAV